MLEIKDNTYSFSIKGKDYEVFLGQDGHVEIYEEENPANSGFIFSDRKKFIVFINNLTDIMEKELEAGDKYECEEVN